MVTQRSYSGIEAAKLAALQAQATQQAAQIAALQAAYTVAAVPVPIGPATYYATASATNPLNMQIAQNNASTAGHVVGEFSWTAPSPCRLVYMSGRYPNGVPTGQTARNDIYINDAGTPAVTGNTINGTGPSAINWNQAITDSAAVRLATNDLVRMAQVRNLQSNTLNNVAFFFVVWL